MTRLQRIGVIAGVVASFAGLVIAGSAAHDKLVTARDDAARARAATSVALQHAAHAEKTADSLVAIAAHYDSIRRTAELHAAVAEQKTAKLRAAFDTTAQSDDCDSVCQQVADAADAVIDMQDSTIADLHQALAADSVQRANLTFALDTTRAALVKLQVPASELVVADAKLAKASRRPFLLRILPHAGIGAAAGFGPGGKPAVLTGITFSWAF